jgi:sigma-B regulation protein RsbU (phosphoserine phosphatase)
MRMLVGWDDPEQSETISLFLNVDDDSAVITGSPAEMLQAAHADGNFDAVLMAVGVPDMDDSFEVFTGLKKLLPDVPVVGACQPADVYRMAKFLTQGMRNYVLRDSGGDFVFLLHATLQNTVEGVRAERERLIAVKLREEISSVRKLQESMIPSDLQNPPGYQLAARYEPSQIRVLGGQPVVMAGGDYYEVFRIDENHTVILVGDASGHGMKACMSIMTMHTLITLIRSQGFEDVASFVATVNNRLCEQSFIQSGGGFITVLYGVLNAKEHRFTWTSAGHPIPLLCRRDTGTIEALGPHESGGLPLGLYGDAEYETHTCEIPPNGRLLIYTDGLIEAMGEVDGHHQEFGFDGVHKTLHRHHASTAADTLNALFDDSEAMTGGIGRHDDTSLVVVDRMD